MLPAGGGRVCRQTVEDLARLRERDLRPSQRRQCMLKRGSMDPAAPTGGEAERTACRLEGLDDSLQAVLSASPQRMPDPLLRFQHALEAALDKPPVTLAQARQVLDRLATDASAAAGGVDADTPPEADERLRALDRQCQALADDLTLLAPLGGIAGCRGHPDAARTRRPGQRAGRGPHRGDRPARPAGG